MKTTHKLARAFDQRLAAREALEAIPSITRDAPTAVGFHVQRLLDGVRRELVDTRRKVA